MTNSVTTNAYTNHYEIVQVEDTRVTTINYGWDNQMISAQIVDKPADRQGPDSSYTVTQNYDGAWHYVNAQIVTQTGTQILAQNFDAAWRFTGAIEQFSDGLVQTRDAAWGISATVYAPGTAVPLSEKPGEFLLVGDTIYASGGNSVVGNELYKLNATLPGDKPVLVADLNSAAFQGSDPHDFHLAGDTLYFLAHAATGGDQLFSLNTADPNAKVVQVLGTVGHAATFSAEQQVQFGDDLFFATRDDPQLFELDRSGPDAGLRIVEGAASVAVTHDGDRSTAVFYDQQNQVVRAEIDTANITGHGYVASHEVFDSQWHLVSWTGYGAAGDVVESYIV